MADNNNNIYCLLPVLLFAYALCGLWQYLNIVERNSCDMTYMFEYPEYLRIPLNYNSTLKFPRYKLFVYGEGKYAEALRSQSYQGIPILFIPGNAGSHRQVRSLASVSYRISQSRQTSFHFNYFTIDFNEEISALYGGTLNDQTEFVQECIHYIQALYHVKQKVILIGHSMGGVIAKAIFSLSNFDPADVSLILTLATPHRSPVLALDHYIINFYNEIQSAWRYRLKAELRNIPLISIGGGQRDSMVRSDLIQNNFEYKSPLDVHVLTSAIPGVWLSTDHLAIVWCKQLVLTMCRSLFDLNIQGTHQLSNGTDLSILKNILHFHYVSRIMGHHWPGLWFLPARSFPSSGQWIEQRGNAWRFSRNKVLSSIYILVPISLNGNIIVVASGLVKGDWIFGCTKQSNATIKTCLEAENLSNKGEVIPSRKSGIERKKIHFRNEDLSDKEYTSVLVHISPVNSQIEILGETYSNEDRVKHYKLRSVLERIFSWTPHRIFTISLVDQIVYYNVTFPGAASVFKAVEFQLETRLCRAGSVVGQGIIKMTIPWSQEESYYPIRTSLGGLTIVPVQVHSLPPPGVRPDVNLFFILDPECSVVLTEKFSLFLMASQFMKFYGFHIIGYTISLLLILLYDEMLAHGSHGTPSSIYSLFPQYSSYITLVVLPSVLYSVLSSWKLSLPHLLYPDQLDPSLDFWHLLFLRSILYFISGGLIICLHRILEWFLKVISFAWIFTMRKNILKKTQVPMEHLLRTKVNISNVTLICTSLLATLSVTASSSIATLLTTAFYLEKLVSLYTQCSLEVERRGHSTVTFRWYFHFILVLLWIGTLLLTSPGLIMWLRNLSFSLKLSNDVYVLPCTVMIVSSGFLWQLPTPIINKYKYTVVAHLIQVTSVVTVLYGVVSVYRLLYYIALIFFIICVQQTFAYFYSPAFAKCD